MYATKTHVRCYAAAGANVLAAVSTGVIFFATDNRSTGDALLSVVAHAILTLVFGTLGLIAQYNSARKGLIEVLNFIYYFFLVMNLGIYGLTIQQSGGITRSPFNTVLGLVVLLVTYLMPYRTNGTPDWRYFTVTWLLAVSGFLVLGHLSTTTPAKCPVVPVENPDPTKYCVVPRLEHQHTAMTYAGVAIYATTIGLIIDFGGRYRAARNGEDDGENGDNGHGPRTDPSEPQPKATAKKAVKPAVKKSARTAAAQNPPKTPRKKPAAKGRTKPAPPKASP
jgi:hypothetical protein